MGPRLFSSRQGRLLHPVGVAMAAVSVEGADSDGDQTEEMLRGDAVVVEQRRLQAVRGSRARAAVQAELDKLRLLPTAPVAAAALQKEWEAVKERGAIAPNEDSG